MNSDFASRIRPVIGRPSPLWILFLLLLPTGPVRGMLDEKNSNPEGKSQWTIPTDKGPDKEVPGFLYNLGPTGARAILKKRSFVVKYVFSGSPAAGRLLLDDEIYGVNDNPFSTDHLFGNDYGIRSRMGLEGPIMEFADAIEACEGGDGILHVNVIRKGEKQKVSITLGRAGRFANNFPSQCEKSRRLASNAIRYILEHPEQYMQAECNTKATVGLALIAARRMDEARKLAISWNRVPTGDIWTWPVSYQCIFLCEYFLATGDAEVLEPIRKLVPILYAGQVMDPVKYKDRVHGGQPSGKDYLKGGLGHRVQIDGYGTMNITTLLALLAWELAEECGVEVNRKHMDLAYECVREHTHKSGYMGYRFADGAYSPVGRQGLSIIVHRLSGDPSQEDYIQRVASGMADAKNRMNDAHADSVLGLFWGLLGIQRSGDPTATREVLDYNRALINIMRTHDGSFVALPGRNIYESAYYRSSRMQLTAAMALILTSDQPRLRMLGDARRGTAKKDAGDQPVAAGGLGVSQEKADKRTADSSPTAKFSVSPEVLAQWQCRFVKKLDALAKAGREIKVDLGDQEMYVVRGANETTLLVRIQGNDLPMPWKMLSLGYRAALARSAATDEDMEALLIAAVLNLANDERSVAELLLAKAAAHDPKAVEKVKSELMSR